MQKFEGVVFCRISSLALATWHFSSRRGNWEIGGEYGISGGGEIESKMFFTWKKQFFDSVFNANDFYPFLYIVIQCQIELCGSS